MPNDTELLEPEKKPAKADLASELIDEIWQDFSGRIGLLDGVEEDQQEDMKQSWLRIATRVLAKSKRS